MLHFSYSFCVILTRTLVVALLATPAFAAQESPRGVVFEGRAYDAAENPILDTNTTFLFKIYNPAKDCLLYQETQTGVNLNTAQGFFALEIGSATGSAKRSGFDPGLTMSQVYQNLTLVVGKDAVNANCNYTPTAGDQRVLVVTMTPAVGAADTFPDIAMNSVPQALVAETLQGILPAGLIQVSGNVTQANMTTLTGAGDASALHHHNSLYIASGAQASLGNNSNVTGSFGIGTTTPSTHLGFGGNTDRTIGVERTTGTDGADLTMSAGGAVSGGTDRAGGDLVLSSGISTGTGTSKIEFKTATAAGTGTADNAPSTKMTILGNGNVGIGTTSPLTKLEVVGDTRVGNIASTGYLYVMSQFASTSSLVFSDNGSWRWNLEKAGTTHELNIKSYNSGSTVTAMTVQQAGNVGVGTSSPTSRIHGSTTLSAATGDEVAYQLDYVTNKATSGADTGLLINMTDTASPGVSLPLDIKVGGISRFKVNQAGTVTSNDSFFVGTQAYFVYNGLSLNNSGGTGFVTLNSGNGAGSLGVINGSASADGSLTIKSTTGVGTTDYIRMNVGNNGATEALRIISSGNIGVGTTAPASRLQVGDTTVNTANQILLGKYQAASENNMPIVQQRSAITPGTSNDLALGAQSTSGGIVFYTGDASPANQLGTNANAIRMTINSSGNVGIGTSTPTSRIHGSTTLSAATGNEVAYQLDYTTNKATSGNDTGFLINMTDTASPGTSYLFDAQVGGSSKFFVTNLGQLSVGGDLMQFTYNSVALFRNNSTSSGSGMKILGAGHADSFLHLQSTGGVGTSDYIKFTVGNNGATEAMRIINSGNVGVGTTTPGTKLDVSGAISVREMAAPAVSPANEGRIYFDSTDDKFKVSENGGAYSDLIYNYPLTASMTMDEATVLTGGAITYTTDAAHAHTFMCYQTGTSDADSFEIKFFMKAGTYTMSVLGATTPQSGRIDWYLNNTLFSAAQEWYTAGNTFNVVKTAAITLTTSGSQTLKGVVNGKHASSSDYAWLITKIWIK